LRGLEFVTRKITDSVAKIKLGKLDCIELGNLDAKRDWGFAKDYVEGMWLMLQAEKAESYVLATNRTETIRNFVAMAFNAADIRVNFEGQGDNEIAFDESNRKVLMKINSSLYRPAEVDLLIGDFSKANKLLGWYPKTNLEALCKIMIESDIERNKNGNTF
jgi:GDPmannose 4,6-dehydratase